MEKRENSRLLSGLPIIAFMLGAALLFSSCGGGDGSSSTATLASLAVWEPPPVVTIYFAGTGMTEGQWQENSSSWDREVIASLHKWQETSDIHKKTFIDGIGTGCNYSWDWFNVIDLINQGVPGMELCRGWETNIGDAVDFLRDEALPELDGNIILNLVGFSRGGITTMRFANRVAAIDSLSSRIEKINILAFDPVAGDTTLSPSEFVLTSKVAQYVGIYATDERTAMFSPTLPDFESGDTEVWMFRVPGAHETMVGNPETDGHSTNLNLWCGFFEECTDPRLLEVSWVTTFISTRLLGSSRWGGLDFDMPQLADWHPGLNAADADDQFVGQVTSLWDYNYFNMRKFAAVFIVGFESCSYNEDTNTLTYAYYSFLDWPVFSGWPVYGGWNHERCTDMFYRDYWVTPLEDVWQRQLLETGPFMGVDPLDDGEWALAKLRQLGKSPPIADAGGPYDGVEGTSVVFNASGSTDPDGDPVTIRWDFENDGIWDTSWSDDPAAEHTYGDDYTGVARVEVNDGTGTDIASAVVIVLNVAPTAGIDTIQGPNPHFILPKIHSVSFMGNYSDPGWLDSHTSTWDVGDGWILPGTITGEHAEPFATGTTATEHTYADSGTYAVVLDVMDDDGGVVTTTGTVTVATAGEAAEIINDYIQGLPEEYFKNNSDSRKNAFANKMDVVCKMIAADKIDQALSKLLHDIRSKVSGNSDSKPQNDWITDPSAQEDLCMMIDDLIAFLE